MANQHKNSFLLSFSLLVAIALVLPFISSCGKNSNANPAGLNTQLQIINLSPDAQPFNLYQRTIKQSTTTYTYPNNSDYFFLGTLDPPLQLRTATTAPVVLPFQIDTALKANSKYTLFVTGYRADSSIKNSMLSLDTATLPSIGNAKIRFAHTSPSSPTLNLRINDTLSKVFENRPFNTISKYVTIPAGSYNLTIATFKTPTKIEYTIPNVTIQDGHAYTIYTIGIVGRTDSVAFGAAVLNNNLLIKTTQ
jgi:hypothetical protein